MNRDVAFEHPAPPGQDSALAIAHVILTKGLWSRDFVGDFKDGANRFVAGQTVNEASFEEKHTHGVVAWWNLVVKSRTRSGRPTRVACWPLPLLHGTRRALRDLRSQRNDREEG